VLSHCRLSTQYTCAEVTPTSLAHCEARFRVGIGVAVGIDPDPDPDPDCSQ